MKHITLIFFMAIHIALTAQITVTTLTSEFNGSGGLSIDANGNVYIADFGDFLGGPDTDGIPNNIMKLDTENNLTVFATNFVGASGNSFDNNGILYQSDIRDNAIYRIIDGERELVTSQSIVSPVGIAFDSDNNFYVCNCGDSTIRKVTPDGISTLFSSGSLFACPNGMTIDEDNNLYVVNFSNTNIVKITPDGTPETIANTTSGNGHIDYDPISRNLYIANYGGQQIFSLNIDTPELTLLAGTGVRGNEDGLATEATFSTPNGIVISNDGDSLYVNCAVPLSGTIINPQIVRRISGLNSLSVNDAFVKNASAYPNPARDTIIIELNLKNVYNNLRLQVFDVLGKKIEEIENCERNGTFMKHTLDVSSWNSGNYMYSIIGDGKSLYHGKIVKE